MPSAGWKDESNLTTISDLHKDLTYHPSSYHSGEFLQEEEEILKHYKDWAYFANFRFKDHPDEGRQFYDIDQVLYYDLMAIVDRGAFGPHFNRIGPFFANAKCAYRNLEIHATSKTSGWSSMVQRYWGTSIDGVDFDFVFRMTGILQKKDGKWRVVHEHLSFPADLETGMSDFKSGVQVDAVDKKQ